MQGDGRGLADLPGEATSEPVMSRPSIPIERYMTPRPVTIGYDQPLSAAHKLMRQHKVRHLPVLKGGHLVGVLSQRDLCIMETVRDTDPTTIPVEDAMTTDPLVVAPEAPLEDVVQTMAQDKYGSALIMEGNRLRGIFT